MDMEKTGLFIAVLRKELNLTQKELADRIGVTDKAVSKWERGRGFPDVALLEPLARELHVSVTELISGERSTPETVRAQSDSAVIETLRYMKRMSRKTIGAVLIVAGVCLLCSPLFVAGNSLPLFIWGTAVTAVGVLSLTVKKRFCPPKLACELISLGALISAVIFELLQNGVALYFAPSPDERKLETYSYFDILPFGMGMLPPFVTALLTAALLLFTVIVLTAGRKSAKAKNALFICIVVTTAISVLPMVYGFEFVTVPGTLITLSLAISAAFRATANSN